MHQYVQIYFAVLLRRPLQALEIAWWRITGRKVRSLGRLRAAAMGLRHNYLQWIAFHQPEQASSETQACLRACAKSLPPIAVHLHLPSERCSSSAQAAIRSVLSQFHPRWEVYVTSVTGGLSGTAEDARIHFLAEPMATRAAGMVAAAGIAQTSYLVPLSLDCTLTPGALLAYARAISTCDPKEMIIFFADQDARDSRGRRCMPWFKPEWDEDLFLAQDYLSAACAIPVELLRQSRVEQGEADALAVYALLLQWLISVDAPQPRHVPYVATTTPQSAWCRATSARVDLVRNIVRERLGADVMPGAFGTLILHRPLLDPPPKVSVIVPTRDRIDLLETCVEGVLHRTDYPNIELVIADNESIELETLAYFERCRRDPRVKVIQWPHPYNYSAINNFAVSQASGSYVCLLNNDTEVIDPGWLREMIVQAVRPEVGAVGARLFYADRSIQHAGVVVGMGNAAGHAHRNLRHGEPGYFAQALITRGATAVTAACLVVSKDKFTRVGGLDEDGLAIAYNDVDLCLKLRKAGWRNIYTAQAVLIHHESKSRGLDFAPEHLARYKRELKIFQERWGTIGFQDPTHHPALDPDSEEYRFRF